MAGFKAALVTGHWYSSEIELGASGRLINNSGTWVKFMYFCSVLFTFNKYFKIFAFLVNRINETAGLWNVDFEQSLWWSLEQFVFYFTFACEVSLSLCCKSGLRFFMLSSG